MALRGRVADRAHCVDRVPPRRGEARALDRATARCDLGHVLGGTRCGQCEGPRIAAAYGWLRASHRKLDPERSTPYRPYHTHDEIQKLTPGDTVPVDVE